MLTDSHLNRWDRQLIQSLSCYSVELSLDLKLGKCQRQKPRKDKRTGIDYRPSYATRSYALMSLLDRLRMKYGPRAAETLVALSTFAARLRLRHCQPMNILVDNSLLAHAVTHETAWISTGVSAWGSHEIETGYSARIPVRHKDETREFQNVQYLAGIAHLAKRGDLSLMTSSELELEQWNHPTGRFRGYGYFDKSLFSDLKLRSIDGIPPVAIGPEWMNLPSLKEQQLMRLSRSDDPLYLGLEKLLGPKNSQDAWHIRTAEIHGMFCFLTMDFRLCKILDGRRNQEPVRSLQTKVWTPMQLGKYLGLIPVNPVLLSYNDASYPVRADLHWPNSKRNRPRRTDSE